LRSQQYEEFRDPIPERWKIKAMISIIHEDMLSYPDSGDCFSPSVRYPEYRYRHISTAPNRVYEAVRNIFIQAGLDKAHLGAPDWNPLGSYIKPGQKVFLLCNFVQHRRPSETAVSFLCKCTHGSVLRAVTDYVLLAVGKNGTVSFGNAPLQGTDWEAVLQETGALEVRDFYREQGLTVSAMDLRLTVKDWERGESPATHLERAAERNAVDIDLGQESLLRALGQGGPPHFRVSGYNPERTEEFHAGNSHRYVVHRAILDADVVFNVPKLKTHEKVGITCVIKGFVGTVGYKGCLAHHRFGGPERGGDEYPHASGVRGALSQFHDYVHSRARGTLVQRGLVALDVNLRRVLGRVRCIQAGAWHGNDTCWRMAVDLARIVNYADKNGVMKDKRQRTHLCLVDGVIAGEGNGPLSPSAVHAGTLIFGDDIVSVDGAACRTMGFDPQCIPMVREALASRFAHPLHVENESSGRVVFNNTEIHNEAVPMALDRAFKSSRGWCGYVGENHVGPNGSR
jgi:uncharacterized protein (DUF362 family)